MNESDTNLQIALDDFEGSRQFLESTFREYVGAREILSTLSPAVLRRYTKHLPKRPRLTRDEQAIQHGMVAVLHTYEVNALGCTQGRAHFASGLFAAAACEALIIMRLIEAKSLVKRTGTYKRFWRKFKLQPQTKGRARTFGQFLLEQRAEVLFRLAKDVELFHERELPEMVAKVLKNYGYENRLSDFVRQFRNCVHPRLMLQANDRYARYLNVSYSVEGMEAFHANFALCAWELHGRVGSS